MINKMSVKRSFVVAGLFLIFLLQVAIFEARADLLNEKQRSTHAVYLPVLKKSLDLPGRVVMVGYENRNYDIYAMDADGSNRVRLTMTSDSVINLTPTWSPDGRKVAFARFNNGTGREVGIYVMNADGSNLIRLTNSDGLGNDFAPTWSPDGRRIAYHTTNSGQEQIIVVNSDGSGGATVLTVDNYRSIMPHWSPDGRQIVYASTQNVEQNGRFEIFVMNADGSGKTRLTHNPNADDGTPRWSPDGSRMAFYSFRNGQGATYIMNANGSNVQQVPNMPVATPNWSPDGNKLMFIGRPDATSNTEVYVIGVDGSGLTRITETTAVLEDSPDWWR